MANCEDWTAVQDMLLQIGSVLPKSTTVPKVDVCHKIKILHAACLDQKSANVKCCGASRWISVEDYT